VAKCYNIGRMENKITKNIFSIIDQIMTAGQTIFSRRSLLSKLNEISELDSKGCRYVNQTIKRVQERKWIDMVERKGKIFNMGDRLEAGGKVKLRVQVPSPRNEIKLICNGEEIDRVENRHEAEFIVSGSGAYRVEVYSIGRAWIFSNHIKIGL